MRHHDRPARGTVRASQSSNPKKAQLTSIPDQPTGSDESAKRCFTRVSFGDAPVTRHPGRSLPCNAFSGQPKASDESPLTADIRLPGKSLVKP